MSTFVTAGDEMSARAKSRIYFIWPPVSGSLPNSGLLERISPWTEMRAMYILLLSDTTT